MVACTVLALLAISLGGVLLACYTGHILEAGAGMVISAGIDGATHVIRNVIDVRQTEREGFLDAKLQGMKKIKPEESLDELEAPPPYVPKVTLTRALSLSAFAWCRLACGSWRIPRLRSQRRL